VSGLVGVVDRQVVSALDQQGVHLVKHVVDRVGAVPPSGGYPVLKPEKRSGGLVCKDGQIGIQDGPEPLVGVTMTGGHVTKRLEHGVEVGSDGKVDDLVDVAEVVVDSALGQRTGVSDSPDGAAGHPIPGQHDSGGLDDLATFALLVGRERNWLCLGYDHSPTLAPVGHVS